MLGFRYHKASPTDYVLLYRGGRLAAEGAGLSFLYWSPLSTLVRVPLESSCLPFVFKEITSDFQEVTIQGQLSYRVRDPKRLAGLLDYSLGSGGEYASDDPDSLSQRLVEAVQARTRSLIERLSLREALGSADRIVSELKRSLPEDEAVALLGLEVQGVAVASVRPNPEMAKALEAEARESLKRRADDAVYERRNAAVEAERRIKESELNTEIAVEEKKRAIRERKMAADIAVEDARAALVERQAVNDRKSADGRAYALEATLKPLRDMDWKVLLAASSGKLDPGLLIASAFGGLAENAGKIGELNISPDLLTALMKGGRGA
ncbi:MAG: SPFH domain-containing protein [Elusimicrobiota bacterium]|jgi:regulator of protease activity HflC (stomatin/prohibitin superfamily)